MVLGSLIGSWNLGLLLSSRQLPPRLVLEHCRGACLFVLEGRASMVDLFFVVPLLGGQGSPAGGGV